MSIKLRLVLNVLLIAVAIGTISVISLKSLVSIRSSIDELTRNSTPLQVKTTQLQEAVEKLSAEFLRLGLAHNTKEVGGMSGAVETQIEQVRSLGEQVRQLENGRSRFDTGAFSNLHRTVTGAVRAKLEATRSFETEADSVSQALRTTEASVSGIHQMVTRLNTSSFDAVRSAQRANLLRNTVVKQALSFQYKLKDMEAVLIEVDTADKERLTSCKDRLRAANDAIQGVPISKGEPAVFGDVRNAAAGVFTEAKKRTTGLLALRAQALSTPESAGEYAKAKAAIMAGLRSVSDKLTAAIDPMELQLFKSREEVEHSLGLQEQTGRVVGSTALIEMGTKELNTDVRLIMLSRSASELDERRASVNAMRNRISADLFNLQSALQATVRLQSKGATTDPQKSPAHTAGVPPKAGIPAAQTVKLDSIAAIVGALGRANTSIEKIIAAKRDVMASDALMQGMFDRIRLISSEQAKAGDQKLQTATLKQAGTVGNVNRRIDQSFSQVQTISVLAIILSILFSILLAVRILRPLTLLSKTVLSVASDSDFSRRVPIRSKDEVGRTVRAFNSLMDSLQAATSRINTVMDDVAQGNFRSRVDIELNGDLQTLKTRINVSVESLHRAIANIGDVMEGMAVGDFTRQIEVELTGELHTLRENINTTVERLRCAIQDINGVMNGLTHGDFSHHVGGSLSGELGALQHNINETVDTLRMTMSALNEVMLALAQGQFDAQVSAKVEGEFQKNVTLTLQTMRTLEAIIGDVNRVMSEVAIGNLTPRVEVEADGELRRLSDGINTSLSSLQSTFSLVHENTLCVSSATVQTSAAVEQVMQGIQTQTTAVDKLCQSILETTEAVTQVLENTETAQEYSHQSAGLVNEGQDRVRRMLEKVGQMAQNSDRISTIAEAIVEIAHATELLALNAAIEAARAGEHGRGFGVVAQEVSKLAGQVNRQAEEIQSLVSSAMYASEEGIDVAQSVSEEMDAIVQNVLKTNQTLEGITSAMERQTKVVTEMERSVNSLQEISMSDAAAAEEMAASMSELMHMAEQTKDQIEMFRVA